METLSIIVIIVIMAIFLGLVGLKLYSSIKLKGLRQTAIDLIVKAEETYEKGKNDEKFQMVYKGLLAAIPNNFRIFINQNTIEFFIQATFDSIKGALDTKGKENDGKDE